MSKENMEKLASTFRSSIEHYKSKVKPWKIVNLSTSLVKDFSTLTTTKHGGENYSEVNTSQ